MTIHVHRLAGCTPTPLAFYLKALGVLRLVAEQKDSSARGFFRDDVFHLATTLSEAELVRFFLEEYAPTPLVTPWNGGSGFYPKDSHVGLDAIVETTSGRFAAYRAAIEVTRRIVGDRKEKPKDEDKGLLLAACRAQLALEPLSWMNAAVVLGGDTDDRAMYPALLGTGGNDGRLDFANNFMQRIAELLIHPDSDVPSLIGASLFARSTHALARDVAVGQFMPGSAGGANSSSGFDGDSLLNAWDFVLMLEGAIVLAVAVVRRLDAQSLPQAAAPFAVRASGSGYASAARSEESTRGEQWMPVWTTPSTFSEIVALFGEGRLRVGAGRAERAVDAARAIGRLGVARGIESFERYAFLERNGRSNLAVPVGRWPVRAQPNVDLLDEIAPWVSRLRSAAGRDGAPASIARDVQGIESAMMEVCRDAALPSRWEALLVALGAAESALVDRPKATAELRLQPLPPLSPRWISAAASQADGGRELRLATAIASQVAPGDAARAYADRLGTIRAHCLPLDAEASTPRFATGANGLLRDPRVVWTGRDLVADLAAVVCRRAVDAAASGVDGLPLVGRVTARLDDIDAFIFGRTDDGRVAALARPLMAVDYRRADELSDAVGPWYRLPRGADPLPAYGLLRVVYAWDLPSDRPELSRVRSDMAPLRRLVAGDLGGATDRAVERLRAMGARPRAAQFAGSATLARRLAAALAIPISSREVSRALDAICKPLSLDPMPREE